MLYLISYDLNAPGQDYQRIQATIEKCGPAIRCLKSVWMLNSLLTVARLQETIKANSDENDNFIVIDVTGQGRDGWMPKAYWDWMRMHDS